MKRHLKPRTAIIGLCLVMAIIAAALVPGFTPAELMIALKLFLSAL